MILHDNRLPKQAILMKYHVLFVIFEKAEKICNCRLLQIIGGALRVNLPDSEDNHSLLHRIRFSLV